MAIKNISDLNNQANILIPDNNQQLISPADIRNALKDVIDSAINRLSDKAYLNLRAYDSSRTYEAGEGCFYEGIIYEAISTTTGAFDEDAWTARSASSGTWGSVAGDITIQTDLMDLLDEKQDALAVSSPLSLSTNTLSIQAATASQDGYLSQTDWAAFNNKENHLTFSAPLVRTSNDISIQYVSESQDGIVSAEDWMAIKGAYTEISYEDAETAILDTTLQKGRFYKILAGSRPHEKAGTSGSIFVQALDNNKFASIAFLQTRLPRYEEIGASIAGMWTSTVAPEIEELYIYNGTVFKNLTGVSIDTSSPDTDIINWEMVDINTESYKTETDHIHYDFTNDWISYREDKRGNRYYYSQSNDEVNNGIDSFQWGNDNCFSNTIDNGVFNNLNSTEETKFVNLLKTGLYKSMATGINRTYTFQDSDGTVAFLSDVSGAQVQNVTYEDLLTAASNETLVPGRHYCITDFATKHLIPETNVINTGAVEPLICQAISTRELNGKVYSATYPFDTILYDLNDGEAEDVDGTGRTGKIIYRKDPINNLETWYDFRAVKFRRWQIDGTGMATWTFSTSYSKGQIAYYSGSIYKALSNHTSSSNFYTDLGDRKWCPIISATSNYVAWKTSMTDFGNTVIANSSFYSDVLTFDNGCTNISVGKNSTQPYNNIVFMGGMSGHSIGKDCKNMTFYGSAISNTIGERCQGMLFFNDGSYNTVENDSSGIIICNSSRYNLIKQNVLQVFLAGGATMNVFDQGCQNNFANNSASRNEFKRNTTYNYTDNSSSDNVFGVNSSNNIVINGATGNQIGSLSNNSSGANNNFISYSAYGNLLSDGCSNNSITYSANNNRMMEGCSNNIFTYSATANTLDINCSNNTFTYNSANNSLGSGSGYNSFDNASHNSIGRSSSNNTFRPNAHGNSIGNKSDYNTLGINAIGNRIGNYCASNQIDSSATYYYGTSGQHNVLESYSTNNIIRGNYNRFQSHTHFIQCFPNTYMVNCSFCPGTQNIFFNGVFIIDNLHILLSRGYSSPMTVNNLTAPNYNNIVIDMKDSGGNLWFKTINIAGKIITKKFV